jgi:hypothetical protein
MSRAHREILHLARLLARVVEDLSTEALLEQLLIRQLFPRIFPTRHRHPEVTENGAWMVS